MTDAAPAPNDHARRLALAGLLVIALLVASCVDRSEDVDAQPSETHTAEPTAVASTASGTPTEATPSPSSTAVLRPTSAIVPTPAERPDAVARVVEQAAADFGLNPASIMVVSYEARTWPSTALGCPEEGRSYAQIVVSGYEVILSVEDASVIYHADAAGTTIVRCGEGVELAP